MTNNNAKPFLYALSTCIWCRRTKDLLDELGIEYDYIFVDTLEGEEKEKTIAELVKHNPSRSFPTIIIGSEVIVGFQENKIRELLSK